MAWAKFGLSSFSISLFMYIVLFHFYGTSLEGNLNLSGLTKSIELPMVSGWILGTVAKITQGLWVSMYKLSGAISIGCGFACSVVWFYKSSSVSALNRNKISLWYWFLLSTVVAVSFAASLWVFLPALNQFLSKVFVLISGPFVYILIGVVCPADSIR